MITAKELAAELGCSRSTVFRYLKAGVFRQGVYRFMHGRSRYLRFDLATCRDQLRAEGARRRPMI